MAAWHDCPSRDVKPPLNFMKIEMSATTIAQKMIARIQTCPATASIFSYLESSRYGNRFQVPAGKYYVFPAFVNEQLKIVFASRIEIQIFDYISFLEGNDPRKYKRFSRFTRSEPKFWHSCVLSHKELVKVARDCQNGVFNINNYFCSPKEIFVPQSVNASEIYDQFVLPPPSPEINQRHQIVADFLSKEALIERFKVFDSEGKDLKTFFSPQGLNVSHTLSVPVLDSMFGPNLFSRQVANTMDAAMNGEVGIAQMMVNLFTSLQFWIVLYAFVTVYANSFRAKKAKDQPMFRTTNRIQIIILCILLLGVLRAETLGYASTASQFRQFCEYFWTHMHPTMLEHFAMEDDEAVQMDPIYEAPDFTPQGIADFLPEISTSILTLLSFGVGFKVKDKFANAFISMSKITDKQVTNISTFLIYCVNNFSSFLDNLGYNNLAEFFYIEAVNSPAVADFMNKATAFITDTAAGEVLSGLFYAEVHDELMRVGENIIRNLDKNSYDYRIVFDALKKLREAGDVVKANDHSLNGIRIEPVGIIIGGAPGCKKSVFAGRISSIVIPYTLPQPWVADYERNPKDFLYAAPNDKFFERYNYKAWVTVLDDLFQIRDTVGDPESEAVKVIKMINCMEYPLPMADIKDKNSKFFRSQFVMATTNLDNFNSLMSISSPAAVKRRFHVHIKLSVNPKYLNEKGKTDNAKLPTIFLDEEDGVEGGLTGTTVPNDFWKIKMAKTSSDFTGEFIDVSIEDVIETIILGHREHVKHFYVNRAVERRSANELLNSMSQRFPDRNLFSNLAYNTFRPQSGIPGGWLGTESSLDEINMGDFDILKEFGELEHDQKMEFVSDYYNTVLLHSDFSFVAKGVHGIANHLNLLEPSERNEFRHTFGTDTFFVKLMESFQKKISEGINPLNGEPIPKTNAPQNVLNSLKSNLTPILKFVRENRFYLMVILPMVIVGLPHLVRFVKSFFTSSDTVVPQSFDAGKDRAKVGKPVSKSLNKYMSKVRLRPQAPSSALAGSTIHFPPISSEFLGSKNNNNDTLAAILNKYHFIVHILTEVKGEPRVIRLGHAMNIRGRIFAFPLHFIYQLHDIHANEHYAGANVTFTTVTKSTQFITTLEDLLTSFKCSVDSANNDVCLVKVPGAHATSKGMLSYMLKDADVLRLNKVNSFNCSVVGTYLAPDNLTNTLRVTNVVSHFSSGDIITANWQGDVEDPCYQLEAAIKYDGSFNAGECGSLLTVDGSMFENRSVIGMHVAGSPKFGLSNVLTQENMEKLLDGLYPNSTIFVDEERIPHLVPAPLEAQGLMLPLGQLQGKYCPGENLNSSYLRSKLFDKLPEPFRKVKEFPARLKTVEINGVKIDPVKKSLHKFKKDPVCYPPGFVAKAVASYESLIMQHMNLPKEARVVIPLEEALHSFMSVRGISPSTSAGYPMTLPHMENLKRLYYQAVHDEDEVMKKFYLQRIAHEVEEIKLMYKMGTRPAWLYKIFPKDETRPLEKVTVDISTRICGGSPFIMLDLFRMYFGAFMSAYMDANIKVGSAIGLNPYQDWDELARELLKFNKKQTDATIGAGDYKGYDTCERPELLWEVLEMINRWYGDCPADNHLRSQLWAEIINSRHISAGNVYEWVTGMPSGNPLTAIINTIHNHLTLRMAWQVAGYDIQDYNDNVYAICLGDDNAFNVSQFYRANFNELRMPEYMEKLGMNYTTELKATATVPFRAITEVEFLKRGFVYNESVGKWVAPMRIQALFDPLNWCKKGIAKDQSVVDQVTSTISELSLHGRKVFDTYARDLHDLRALHYPGCKPSKDLPLNYDFVLADILNSSWDY